MAKFLKKDLNDERVELLKYHLDFKNMNNNDKNKFCNLVEVNEKIHFMAKRNFFNTGNFDQHQDSMNASSISIFDEWIQEQIKRLNFPLMRFNTAGISLKTGSQF